MVKKRAGNYRNRKFEEDQFSTNPYLYMNTAWTCRHRSCCSHWIKRIAQPFLSKASSLPRHGQARGWRFQNHGCAMPTQPTTCSGNCTRRSTRMVFQGQRYGVATRYTARTMGLSIDIISASRIRLADVRFGATSRHGCALCLHLTFHNTYVREANADSMNRPVPNEPVLIHRRCSLQPCRCLALAISDAPGAWNR